MIIDEGKMPMLRNRILERMNSLGLTRGSDYLDLLAFSDQANEEHRELIESVMIHETLFYRDKAQMRLLEMVIMPELIRSFQSTKNSDESMRIWSAGCSTGAEPFSVVMAYEEAKRSLGAAASPIRILATDLSTKALAAAAEATYSERPVRNAPDDIRKRYFEAVEVESASQARVFHVTAAIRNQVSFRQLNLVADEYPRDLDMIICRNVLIYFDAHNRQRTMEGFYRALKPAGILILGHAETLLDWPEYFRPVFEQESCYYRKWTTCQRNLNPSIEEAVIQKRRPPESRPAPDISIEDREIVWKGRSVTAKTLVVIGLLDKNADRELMKVQLLVFLGATTALCVIDLSGAVFIANPFLRTIRQALAAADRDRLSTIIVARDRKTLASLDTSRLSDLALLMECESWKREIRGHGGNWREIRPAAERARDIRTTEKKDGENGTQFLPAIPDRRKKPRALLDTRHARDDLGMSGEFRNKERRVTDLDDHVPNVHVEVKHSESRIVLSGCLDPARFPDLISMIKESLARLVSLSSPAQCIRVELSNISFISPDVIRVLRRGAVHAREYQLSFEVLAAEERIQKFVARCGGLPGLPCPSEAETSTKIGATI